MNECKIPIVGFILLLFFFIFEIVSYYFGVLNNYIKIQKVLISI